VLPLLPRKADMVTLYVVAAETKLKGKSEMNRNERRKTVNKVLPKPNLFVYIPSAKRIETAKLFFKEKLNRGSHLVCVY
jgi:hypothetical protein